MKTIITYGTFDLFHVGHVKLLARLKNLGDRLVIGLSTDEFNSEKSKTTIIKYADREEILLSCKYVDAVFPETCWEQKRQDIIREKADVFAIGDDWAGKFDSLEDIVDVVYLPRTQNISTTNIKSVMSKIESDQKAEIRNVSSHLQALVDTL
ncbi:adenylyltransferase/cytidyltransferase family protein [Alteromonas gilva]|uniref:Adenylyltransferase/cytidyltransferase family protein n=1 Tax=Alteromonas gilva TaxID=2987522 RepID=A0ABT5L8W8_9ALTE|nr:adenylyltransferase/cytidyltransferase family protein [Alteromonas gilva]MDC8833019.1 adenylyltransferase/cytidyltransferase family protein [Alteromonas gilva]